MPVVPEMQTTINEAWNQLQSKTSTVTLQYTNVTIETQWCGTHETYELLFFVNGIRMGYADINTFDEFNASIHSIIMVSDMMHTLIELEDEYHQTMIPDDELDYLLHQFRASDNN